MEAEEKYQKILMIYSQNLLETLKESILTMKTLIDFVSTVVQNFDFDQLSTLVEKLNSFWTQGWKQLEGNTTLFINSVQNNTRFLKYNITKAIQYTKDEIGEYTYKLVSTFTDGFRTTLSKSEGFGLRFKGGFKLIGRTIFGLDIELVYSIDKLGQCSKLSMVYDMLKDEKAVRLYGGFSTGLVSLIKVHPLIRIKQKYGLGIGIALSLEMEGKFVAQIHVEIRIIGIRGDVDLFLTNNGMDFYLKGNAWDLFKVELNVFAEREDSWDKLALGVKGRFVADGDGDGNFEDSYLTAMRHFVELIANNADKRISQVQDSLTKMQNGLTKAQNWLESKKNDVQKAHAAFEF